MMLTEQGVTKSKGSTVSILLHLYHVGSTGNSCAIPFSGSLQAIM